MDSTSDYGLKTRQVASWLWLRRGALSTVQKLSQQSQSFNVDIYAFLKYVVRISIMLGRRAVVLMLSLLSLQQLFCPTFLRFWPHISESDPPWKKTAHMGLKNYGMVPKKNLWPRHMYKWYILKKKWQKSVNSTHSTGEKIVPVGIWGCHHQLDNHHE